MAFNRATFKITKGPNKGDTINLEAGACRLIGRHLSENETSFIDRDGNRVLDSSASTILQEHLKDKSPQSPQDSVDFSVSAFERGPDVIFADDSISRAHAMVFFDTTGAGIIDLASTNGTFVNDTRINSATVKHNDVIVIGGSEMVVTLS